MAIAVANINIPDTFVQYNVIVVSYLLCLNKISIKQVWKGDSLISKREAAQ